MRTRKLVTLAILLSIGIALSLIDSFLPVPITVMGAKIGLGNIVSLAVLYCFAIPEMIVISLLRAALGSLVFGGVTAAMYSVAGAALSCAMMIFAKKIKAFSIFGVSLLGSVGHNVGQILVACFFLSSTAPLAFLPALLIIGAITSIIIAEGAKYVILGIEACDIKTTA